MGGNYDNCDKEMIINQSMKVKSRVDIKPIVKHGKPKVKCIYSDIQPNYDCSERREAYYIGNREPEISLEKCSFTVTQLLCIEIPIEIGIDVDIDEKFVECDIPLLRPYKPCEETDCIEDDEDSEPEDNYIIRDCRYSYKSLNRERRDYYYE